MKKSHEALTKFCCDYLPLIIFFCVYKFSNAQNPLIDATIYMVIAALIAVIFSYFLTKEVSKIAIFSAGLLAIFGSLTIFLQDEIFIKMKPTVVNLIFALILFYGYFSKKPLMHYIVGEHVKMSSQAWINLSLRWAIFFVFLAVLNELIWRNFPTDFWVKFKVFGMMPISLIFTLSQIPFMTKEMKKVENFDFPKC